jgi:hypothetical protein
MRGKACYLCGSTEDITRDHIPPAGLFPPPLPSNLITVPCCRKCNESFSMTDEVVRLWFSTSVFASQQGKWIYKNKVLNSTLQRSPKLRQNIAKHMGVKTIQTEDGTSEVPTIGFPVTRFNEFAERVCKGLLYHFYPNYDYTTVKFRIGNILPTPDNLSFLEAVISALQYESRGETVFRCWHGFNVDNSDEGVIVLMFYDGCCFLIFFGHGDKYKEPAKEFGSGGPMHSHFFPVKLPQK